MSIIPLKRTEGKAVTALFIRQNTTETKEKELRIQAEISLANRKERQYRIAITSNSICTYDFNLTRDCIEEDVVWKTDIQEQSLLQLTGLKAPCKASELFHTGSSLLRKNPGKRIALPPIWNI